MVKAIKCSNVVVSSDGYNITLVCINSLGYSYLIVVQIINSVYCSQKDITKQNVATRVVGRLDTKDTLGLLGVIQETGAR